MDYLWFQKSSCEVGMLHIYIYYMTVFQFWGVFGTFPFKVLPIEISLKPTKKWCPKTDVLIPRIFLFLILSITTTSQRNPYKINLLFPFWMVLSASPFWCAPIGPEGKLPSTPLSLLPRYNPKIPRFPPQSALGWHPTNHHLHHTTGAGRKGRDDDPGWLPNT